jgi:rRNA maturation endonuclease Nob1
MKPVWKRCEDCETRGQHYPQAHNCDICGGTLVKEKSA